MTFNWGRAYALAATAVAVANFAAPANATTVTWTFDSGTGAASSTAAQTYNADAPNSGFTLTAQGFASNTFGTAVKLYNKNDGLHETGLGLDNDSQHEIKGTSIIEIILNDAHSSTSFTMNSVDNHEGWAIWGSSNGTSWSQLLTNSGLLDEATHTLTGASGALLYYYIAYIDDGSPSGGQGSNILLNTLSIETITKGGEGDPGGTPIPGALWLFGSALAGAAGVSRWRRKRTTTV